MYFGVYTIPCCSLYFESFINAWSNRAAFSIVGSTFWFFRMLETASAEEQLKYRQYLRVRIPENELLVKVDDHLEIKEEYLPYLEQIDFVYIDGNNLKVSNIDWSKTNININPQTVYKKDLSYATFADNNIVFKDFNGCILIGTDISDEKGSYGYENAIIDEKTKLPMNKRGLK